MTEVIVNCCDWIPRKKKKISMDSSFEEDMEVDEDLWVGEDMIVDDEFMDMCFREINLIEASRTTKSLFSLGRSKSRGCSCCRRKFKKYCRKKIYKK